MNVTTAIKTKNPFPGLRPFREDEEHLFFGRENQVDAMVDKLGRTHFLAVVGTSGSGKSSLVNCGLRPGLHGGLMASAGTDWRMAQFRPGKDPIDAMSRALAEDGVLFHDFQSDGLPLSEIMDTTVRMSKLGLVDMYQQAQLPKDTNLLVVVDQFEELFRYQQNDGEKQEGVSQEAVEFVNLLLEAAEQTKYPIYIVLTMRSDFLGDCAQFRGLVEAINDGQYLVPRMTREERRAAIAGPVAVGGAEISPVLLTRLVNDVGDNPDQLSILQHALNRTWAHWENDGGVGKIDLPHYKAIGTMAHALDQHAEKAYGELSTERQQQVCKKVFQALTDKATDPRGTRRPTMMIELGSLADATPEEVKQVIEVFRKPSRSFLMPPAGEALEPGTIIDISHESLMRVWKRLDKWADQEADSAGKFKRVAEAANLHAQGKTSLWQNPELQIALDWRDANQPNEVWAKCYDSGFQDSMRFLESSQSECKKKVRSQLIHNFVMLLALPVASLIVMTGISVFQTFQVNKLERATYARDVYIQAISQRLEDTTTALVMLKTAAEIQAKHYTGKPNNPTYALHYSDTLTAIGNNNESDLTDRIDAYNHALVIRKILAESVSPDDDNWPEYQRKLANAYMNSATSSMEDARLNKDQAEFESVVLDIEKAKLNYQQAQDIRNVILKSGIGRNEELPTRRELGGGHVNLMGFYEDLNNLRYSEDANAGLKVWIAAKEKESGNIFDLIKKHANDAITQFDICLQISPEDLDAHFARVGCELMLARLGEAEFEVSEKRILSLVSLNPTSAKYRIELARVYIHSKKMDEARELLDEILEEWPANQAAKDLQAYLPSSDSN